MTTSGVFLFLAAFLACAVEMVEALTIILAMGLTREWRSTIIGLAAALVALAVLVAALGPLITLVPLETLRLVVGALLLVFGLQWLRKAILRASGFKSQRDEAAIFERQIAAAKTAAVEVRAGMDWYAFTLSFKGVFLEGLEVVFIVLTFGSTHGDIPLAAAAAGAALILVAITGGLVHAPLSRVPENTMKFSVGVMLTSFGIFWGSEGAGVHWPGDILSLLVVLAFVVALSLGLVYLLGNQRRARTAGVAVSNQV